MNKRLLFLFAALLPLLTSAQTKVEIDGTWYNLITKIKQAEVTFKGSSYYEDYDEYSDSITIPATVFHEGVNYSVTSIGDYAFAGCRNLKSITVPESVASIESYAFFGCMSLTTISILEGVASIGESAFSNCHNLTSLTLPESIISIGSGAFVGCRRLTSINIPKGVTSIGSGAFEGCSSFTYITVAKDNTIYDSRNNCNAIIETCSNTLLAGCTATIIPESVTSIGNSAFSGCSSLTSITIPESVTSIGAYTFKGCSGLTSINIPESVTSIGNSAFSGCSSLIAFTIPKNVTSIGEYTFKDCSGLTSINIPESVTCIGNSAFSGCSSLIAINIPKNVTSIGAYTFKDCSGLTSINIPEGVTRIESYTFNKCASLTTINIPKNVTHIGTNAFRSCANLTTFVLPNNLAYIDSGSFAGCSELSDVYCYSKNVPYAESNAFEGSLPEYATLHVPDSAVASYKVTAPWSSFGTIVRLGAAITKITLDKTSATLAERDTLSLVTTTTPANADKNLISWSSSDFSIATVDNTGKVTAIAPGTITITATANDGSGVSTSCKVTVKPASYVVTYLVDGEVFAADTLTCGTPINIPIEPTKEGHTFSGWSEVPNTMPANDVTISGTFAINKYLVTFKIDDTVIASDSLEYGASIVAPEAPEKEGHTFNGWDEVIETVPANDVTIEGSYSVNSYLLTYTVDGDIVQSDSVVYGTTITLLDEPIKEGHTFSGWSEVPNTMPANDVTISGTFAINKYLVTFKIDDTVIASDSLEYGASIVAPGAPEKEGHTFNGWGEVAETVPAHDVTYEGSYSINSYTLTYVVDGEVVLTLPILYGGSIPSLKVPVKEGYTFSGWGEIPETMPAEDVTIEGSFTRLASISLTINQADNGYVKQHLTEGTVCTFTIVAVEGWKIHSVTFNGEDVTAQLTEEGTFTTPALSGDAVLNIAYEKIEDNTMVENARANAIRVQCHQGTLCITGATEGTDISVYTTDGMLVTQESAEDGETLLTLPEGQVYIVTVGDKVVKIGM